MDIEKIKCIIIKDLNKEEKLNLINELNLDNFFLKITEYKFNNDEEFYYLKCFEQILNFENHFLEFIYNKNYQEYVDKMLLLDIDDLNNIIMNLIDNHFIILMEIILKNDETSKKIINLFLYFAKCENFSICRKFLKTIIKYNNSKFINFFVKNYLIDLLNSKNSLYELRIFEFLIEISYLNKEYIINFEENFNFCLCLITKYKMEILEKLNYYEILRSFISNKNLIYLLNKNNIVNMIKEEALDLNNEIYVIRDSNVILCELVNNKIIDKFPFNIEILNKIFKNVLIINDNFNSFENLNILLDILNKIVETKQGTELFSKSKLYPILLNLIHSDKIKFHNILFDFWIKFTNEEKLDLKNYTLVNFSELSKDLKSKTFIKILNKNLINSNDLIDLDNLLNVSLENLFEKINIPFEESILNYLRLFLNYCNNDNIIDKFIKNYKSIEFLLNPITLKELKGKKNMLFNYILNFLNKKKEETYYKEYLEKLMNLNKNYNIYYQTINK